MCRLASFCTQEMDSTPPATKISPSPAMIRCAAMAIVCSPDEQKRFTVAPATVTGQPARSAIWRAMLPPVAPSGVAQPISTSSTSAGSSLARSIACLTTWPPIVAPWVMFSAPRQDLARPVRAVETTTASFMRNAPARSIGRSLDRTTVDAVPGLSEHAPHHRLEHRERQGFFFGIERRVVVQLAKLGRAFEIRESAKSLADVAIHVQVMEEVVSLKDAVLLHHPVILLRHERFQDRRRDIRMVEGAERIADVMQQRAYDILLVAPG